MEVRSNRPAFWKTMASVLPSSNCRPASTKLAFLAPPRPQYQGHDGPQDIQVLGVSGPARSTISLDDPSLFRPPPLREVKAVKWEPKAVPKVKAPPGWSKITKMQLKSCAETKDRDIYKNIPPRMREMLLLKNYKYFGGFRQWRRPPQPSPPRTAPRAALRRKNHTSRR